MARRCWVVAVEDGLNKDVYFYKKKKTAVKDGDREFGRHEYFHFACEKEFHRFTGLKLELGKIVKVRFSGEILSK